MRTTSKNTVRLRLGARGLVTALGVAALTSWGCESADSRGSTDGNTSFLQSCDTDADCNGTFSCTCGLCSRPCSAAEDCEGLPAAASCTSGTATSCTNTARYCAPSCAYGRQCGAGLVCVDDACVPDEAPGAGGAGSGGASPGGAGGGAQAGGAPAGAGGSGVAGGGAGGGQASGGRPGNADAGPDADANAGACLEADVLEDAGTCTSLVCSTDAGVEIRLTRAGGFYVGALFWNLVACSEVFSLSHHPGGDTTTVAFPLSNTQLSALPPDAPLLTFYGAPSPGSPIERAISCGALSLNLPVPIGACPD